MKLRIYLNTENAPNECSINVTDETNRELLIERITFDWKAGGIPKVRLTLVNAPIMWRGQTDSPVLDMPEEDLRNLADRKGFKLVVKDDDLKPELKE